MTLRVRPRVKASLIKKYLDPTNNGKWKHLFDDSLKTHGGKLIYSCNLHKDDIPLLRISQSLCLRGPVNLSGVALYDVSDVAAISDANVGDQTIWLNSSIRIDNRPVFHKHWLGHGVCKISHLLDDGGNLLGYDVMKSNFQDLNC